MNYNDALQHLLSAANIYAPDGKVQAKIANMVADMQKSGENPSDIGVQVLLYLADGLRHGNW